MILLIISFVAGVLTVLAPCVLPLLPVIVGGTITGGVDRIRAYVVTASLAASIILFTLALKVSSVFIMVPPSFWQWLSGGIITLFGLSMFFPQSWDALPFVHALYKSSNRLLATGYQQNTRLGDVVMGAALGPVFASCSPTYFVILASVLPASFLMGLIDLLAYAAGLSLMLLLIALIGQRLVDKLGVTVDPRGWFRRGMGILFLVVGISILTGTMAKTEAWLLEHGFDITVIEQQLLKANEPDKLQCTDASCIGSEGATRPPESKAGQFSKAPELRGIADYINTDGKPITLADYLGKKVVLIDIWTYSCINCQRTLPYLKMWHDTYKDQGLEIIGVHTPEFAFEKVLKNVENAVREEGLAYPIVLDNNFSTWNAFGNQFWPRKYLIDIDGYIVYDHVGEGNYEEAERAIQKALAERNARLGLASEMPSEVVVPSGTMDVDFSQIGSPETYFGAARNENLGSGNRYREGRQTLTIPSNILGNVLYLAGNWTFTPEFAGNETGDAEIKFRYDAKNVYFVGAADTPVKVKVTRDGGKPLGEARGGDVDESGQLIIQENRLYKLIEDSDYSVHTIEIMILTPGLRAYTFTFG